MDWRNERAIPRPASRDTPMQEFSSRTTRAMAAQDDRQQQSGSLERVEGFPARIDRRCLVV